MAISNSPISPLGEADEFLSAALEPQAPSRLVAVYRFPELDVQQAQAAVLIIPADIAVGRFMLNSEILSVLRGEIQIWLKALRDQGHMVTELLSASVRDQSVRHIAQKLLDVAYSTPLKAWMTMLPTGRQVVIVPSEVVNMVGFEPICRMVHERAIRTAQSLGQPYNTQALTYYQNARPGEFH